MSADDKSSQSETLLGQQKIHTQWQSDYLNSDLDRFYDLAFADILKVVQPKAGDRMLDAGCGYCYHTVRLARSAAFITAIDFSKAALAAAERTILDAGIGDRTKLQHADLTNLPFDDDSFDSIISWGVIMHVPQMEKALSELARVLKPGGVLVLSENNLHSPDVAIRERTVRILKDLIGRPQAEIKKTERGTEAWSKEGSGGLMVRKTDFEFLKNFLVSKNLFQFRRTAGQLTELYTNLPSHRLKRLIYALNLFYYRHIGIPSLAMGNIAYFRKEK